MCSHLGGQDGGLGVGVQDSILSVREEVDNTCKRGEGLLDSLPAAGLETLTTRVSEGQSLARGGDVHAAGHSTLGSGAELVHHHGGGRDQAVQVQELELPHPGEHQDGGGPGRHAAEEQRLEHGHRGGGEGPQGS